MSHEAQENWLRLIADGLEVMANVAMHYFDLFAILPCLTSLFLTYCPGLALPK